MIKSGKKILKEKSLTLKCQGTKFCKNKIMSKSKIVSEN